MQELKLIRHTTYFPKKGSQIRGAAVLSKVVALTLGELLHMLRLLLSHTLHTFALASCYAAWLLRGLNGPTLNVPTSSSATHPSRHDCLKVNETRFVVLWQQLRTVPGGTRTHCCMCVLSLRSNTTLAVLAPTLAAKKLLQVLLLPGWLAGCSSTCGSTLNTGKQATNPSTHSKTSNYAHLSTGHQLQWAIRLECSLIPALAFRPLRDIHALQQRDTRMQSSSGIC